MSRRLQVLILFFLSILVVNALTGCRTVPAQPEQQAQKEQLEQKVLPVSNAASPEPDLDSAAARMATAYASAPESKWKKVAVGNLLDPRGQKATLSGSIAGAIETALAQISAATGAFVVVKRRDISRTAAEWKLDLAGAPAPPSFKMIKTLLGADVLIIGDAVPEGKFFQVSMRAVDTATGTVLWRESVSVRDEASLAKGTPIDEGKPLRSGSIKVDLWSDKEAYGAGDAMTINFKASQDCYITLIEVDTSGKMRILFPNRLSKENRAIANKTYSVGGKDSGYAVSVSGPVGSAIVRAIATPAPMVSPASDSSKKDSIFQSIDDAPAFARELTIQTMVTPPFLRGANLIRIPVRE